MRAFTLNGYGGPDEMAFRDLPIPTPGRGELLVRVHAAGLNPVDYKFREGMLRPIYRPRLPVIMGNELSGIVVERDPAASRFDVGDRVFVRGPTAQLGTFAEYACVPEQLVAKVPAALDLVVAGGVPLAGLTALQALRDVLHLKQGQRILITGGAGGVGTFAIQIAKWIGANVTTTVSPSGESLAHSLGADRVIDYTRQSFDQELRDLDGVFDLVGGETLERSFRLVKPGGMVVSIAGVPEPMTARKDLGRGWPLALLFWLASLRIRLRAWQQNVHYRYYFMHGSGSDLESLAQLIDAGRLRVVVDRIFPFAQIQAAFAYLEQGHAKGKVIVKMESAQ